MSVVRRHDVRFADMNGCGRGTVVNQVTVPGGSNLPQVAGSETSFVAVEGAWDIRRTIPGLQQREAIGRALRRELPRKLHGEWQPAPDRPDPVDVVRTRNRGRQQRLVPIRLGRMVASPFAFYRGSADLMAIDLRTTPSTGLVVQLCGDAHLSNFGVYASPERHLAVDINDFDETSQGRWEWDIKRLVASVELCGRDNGLTTEARAEAVAVASHAYRALLRRMAGLSRLDVHYMTFGEGATPPAHWSPESTALVARERKRAYSRTNAQLGVRMTESGGQRLRMAPPLLTAVPANVRESVVAALEPYLTTVPPDIQELLKDYGVLDVAHKVVGVGSVGTRDYVVLLQGNHVGDELFLQVKEALPSVVREPALPGPRHHGQRVVDGQRRIQSVSDPFLGWTMVGSRPFFVRQLRDMKAGVDPQLLQGPVLRDYAELCGAILAKAHARTGYPSVVASYCGTSDRFDLAMVAFARTYADQVERDHAALVAAVKAGALPAELGV
jgi:uncharacterized protein (DUF2252 family)